MAHLQFFGASGTVTGSCFLLTTSGDSKILIDCGLFQGPEKIESLNFSPLAFEPRLLSGVVITHAHLDHIGKLPLLVKMGFRGKIFMTEATKSLAYITLIDSAKILREHHPDHDIYDEKDVEQALGQVETAVYGQVIKISGAKVILRDAGHILGSASVEIADDHAASGSRKFVFSGDLGNTPEELVAPTYYIDRGDVVVMESTYGDRSHAQEDPDQILAEEIQAVEAAGSTLLIPAFAVERTQEILHKIDHLKKTGRVKNNTQVFLDSPMAVRATMVYKQFRELYSRELSDHSRTDDPFDFSSLMLVEKTHDSKRIFQYPGAKVVIAGSGMMTGGRILHHATRYLPDPQNRILFVGFQAEESLGRAILEGAKVAHIGQHQVRIAAHVRRSSGMSAHADQPKLLSWLRHIQGVRRVFLVHGENMQREALRAQITFKSKLPNVYLPGLDEQVFV